MSDDLVKRLRETIGLFTQGMDDLTNEAADRIEALEAVAAAAHGLSFGTDWNNGSHAKMHGYRNALLVALARLMGGKASPAAIRALREKE